jgi:hypothetical protein
MEGLVAMWEKQAATAEKVILTGWIYLLDVWWIFLLHILPIH